MSVECANNNIRFLGLTYSTKVDANSIFFWPFKSLRDLYDKGLVSVIMTRLS